MGTYFSGRVHSVIFSNPAQDFYILRVVLDRQEDDAVEMFSVVSNKPVVVKGNIPGLKIEVNSWFGFEGKWVNHPQHGRQLSITKAPVMKGEWNVDTAVSMLCAHGVGERVCQRLASHFGEMFLEVLNAGDVDALKGVPSITPFTAQHVVNRWKLVRAYFQTLEFLSDAGVPKTKIGQVWAKLGDKAEEVLSDDPWALVRIDGIKFDQADEVALRLGLDMNSPNRVRGATLYSVKDGRGMGHLYLSTAEMVGSVQGHVPATKAQQVAEALASLHKSKDIIVDRTTRRGTTAIYEPWSHLLEQKGAELLCARMTTADPFNPAPVPKPKSLTEALSTTVVPYPKAIAGVGPAAMKAFEKDPEDLVHIAKSALEDWSAGSHIVLSAPQMVGALNALTAPVSVLTGLPGTGKTTTLQAVVSILKDAEIPFLLCAPTGIAAKRMSSLTGAEAATIHRAFGARGWKKGEDREATYVGVVGGAHGVETSDGSAEEWGHGPDNPHPARVVICDEFSMVDQHLLYRILTCTSPTCRLVFVGDAAQLPSVGAGNVLRDIIETKQFPTVALTEIFRQEETSDIVIAAHATHRGEVPPTSMGKDSDFNLIGLRSESEILDTVVKIAGKLYGNRENFQVLSPRHAGTLGVTNLNQKLRDVINPKAPGLGEMRLGSEVVREDDRVMVVKNNYDLGIFNGDVGKIVRVDLKAGKVEIKIHGPPVQHVIIPSKDAPSYLRMAYAMTVHKSQGQEYDVIVLPMTKGFGHQLQRNLFYTAITRARKRVIIVGHSEAMAKAVYNDREDLRNTLFPDRLMAEFEAAGGSVVAETA